MIAVQKLQNSKVVKIYEKYTLRRLNIFFIFQGEFIRLDFCIIFTFLPFLLIKL